MASLLSLVGLTLAARLFRLASSFDLFVDEITYLRLGQAVALDQLTPTLYGEAFFLHPPLFFYLEAAYLRIFPAPAGVFEAVGHLRILNVALSAATALVLGVLVRRVAGSWAGLAAVAIYSLDPFTIRINSRVLLETTTVLLVVGGYSVLAAALASDAPTTRPRAILAGALFGLAVLTKEVSAIVTVGPLVVMAAGGFVLPRRRTLEALWAAILVYLPYPLLTALSGQWSVFLEEKSSGILRFLGSIQTTGFNHAGSVAFQRRVLELITALGTTYIVLFVGGLAALVLVWRGNAAEHLLASWAIAANAYAGYSILLGTLEEQLFYFVVVPAIATTVVLVAGLLESRWHAWRDASQPIEPAESAWLSNERRRLPRARRRLVRTRAWVTITAGILVLSAWTIWIGVRTQPDDAYARLLGWMAENVPPGTSIAVGATSSTAEFVLSDGYVPVKATSVTTLRERDVQYVILGSKAIETGTVFTGIGDQEEYSDARNRVAEMIEWLRQDGRVVFTASGRSTGTLQLYDIRSESS